MKKLLLAICMLLAIDVSAQVTITQNDMPGAGMPYTERVPESIHSLIMLPREPIMSGTFPT